MNRAAEADPVSPESVPGSVIDGKYRIERVLGRGGVGLVVAATHVELSQRVAIKMIRDDVPMQRELLDRFLREARAAVMIQSEHVARVLDVGRLPTGRPYIVMEYLEGQDLEQVVSRGPLEVMQAVDYVLQACEALAEAHRSGIIHRDLKPANLFLTRRPDGSPLIKILDFGISKIAPLTAIRGTRGVETTSIMGSPGYMAPEQMKSTKDVDARADVWALGAVLYELVVGKPAFEGATMIEILNAIAACCPTPPSERQSGIPPQLDTIIGHCLQAEPEHRCQSVVDLALALQPFSSREAAGLAARAQRIAQEPPPIVTEAPFSMLRSEPRPAVLTVITSTKRRARAARAVTYGIVSIVLAGAIVTVYAIRSSAWRIASEPQAAASAAPAPGPPLASVPPSPPATGATRVEPPTAPASAGASASASGRVYISPVRRSPTTGPRRSITASPDHGGVPAFGDRK